MVKQKQFLGAIRTDIEGFILAGGESSRFGSDKALALWQGRPLIAHALRALQGFGSKPRIVCRNPFPYTPWSSAFVLGECPGLGPLEGLRAALASLSAPWALVLAVDMPAVRKVYLRHLLDAANVNASTGSDAVTGGIQAVVFEHAGRRHPFPGLYHASLLPLVESLPPGSGLQNLLDRAKIRTLSVLDKDTELARALRGVNTREDLGILGRD